MIWLIAGLALGAALGALATWWWTRARGGGDTIGQLKRENERFREEVTEHFVETARLINQMTDSYKAVFDHLSQGADKLVDDKSLAEKMPRVSSQEVRLRHLGATDGGRKSGGPDARTTAAPGGKPTARDKGDEAGGKDRPKPADRPDTGAGSRAKTETPSDGKPDPLKSGKSGDSSNSSASGGSENGKPGR